MAGGGMTVTGEPIVSIVNGTVNVTQGKTFVDTDTGAIGPDGKRTGAMADMPSFVLPVAFALAGTVLLAFTCAYMSYCVKSERPSRKPEPSRRQREGVAP